MTQKQDGEEDADTGAKRSRTHVEEKTTDERSEETQVLRRSPGTGARQPVEGSTATAALSTGARGPGQSQGTVDYDPGPDRSDLASSYGLEFVKDGQASRVQRLESEFGEGRVQRWVNEGMTVDAMGKPRDMQAFRDRQAARPAAVPTDVERRNQASLQRNGNAAVEDGPAGNVGAPDAVRRVISSSGTSMEETVQREMESKMGGDFSDVQVHNGPSAAAAADSINARAFTVGNHVAFNRGEYKPSSTDGKRVLAHELAHVRQQTDGRVSLLPKADADGDALGADEALHVQAKLEVSSPDDPAEKEAERVAEAVVQMDEAADGPASRIGGAGTVGRMAVHRQETGGGGGGGGGSASGQGDSLQQTFEQNTSLDDGTVSKLVRDIRTEGLGEDTIMRLVDQFGWVFGTLGSVTEMLTLARWADSLKTLGYSADDISKMWTRFFTNPPWGSATPLLDDVGRLSELNKLAGVAGDVLSVIGAALTGWKVGKNLREGKIGVAFAEAYKGIMGVAVPVGGLIDGVIKVIHLVFGNVPYLETFADVLKSLNPIELGGIAVDTLISSVQAIVTAASGGNALPILLRLEDRIEKVAWPIIKLSEVSGLAAVLSAGFDTLITISNMIYRMELSTEQVRNLVERFKEYGLGPLVAAGEKLGAAAFEATEAASAAWDEAGNMASDAWSSVTSYF